MFMTGTHFGFPQGIPMDPSMAAVAAAAAAAAHIEHPTPSPVSPIVDHPLAGASPLDLARLSGAINGGIVLHPTPKVFFFIMKVH